MAPPGGVRISHPVGITTNSVSHTESLDELDRIMRIRERLAQRERSLHAEHAHDSSASDDVGSDKHDDSDDDSSSSSSSDGGANKKTKRKAKKQKKKKANTKRAGPDGAVDLSTLATLLASMSKPSSSSAASTNPPSDLVVSDPLLLAPANSITSPASPSAAEIAQQVVQLLKQHEQAGEDQKSTGKIGSKVAFKRVDQVYDRKIHNYKLKETVQGDTQTDKWDQVIPLPRRLAHLTDCT